MMPIARSLACSSTKRTPALTKKEMRPKTCSISSSSPPSVEASDSEDRGARLSGLRPPAPPSMRSRAPSSTAIALLIA